MILNFLLQNFIPKNKYFAFFKYSLFTLLFCFLLFNIFNSFFIINNLIVNNINYSLFLNYFGFLKLSNLNNFISIFYLNNLLDIFNSFIYYTIKYYYNLINILDNTFIGDYFYNTKILIPLILILPFLLKTINNFIINNHFTNKYFIKQIITLLLYNFKLISLISIIIIIDCAFYTLFNFSFILLFMNNLSKLITLLFNNNLNVSFDWYNKINYNFINGFSILTTSEDLKKVAEDVSKASTSVLTVERIPEATRITVNDVLVQAAAKIIKDNITNPLNIAAAGIGGGAGATAMGRALANSTASPLAKGAAISGTAGVTAFTTSLGTRLGSSAAENMKTFAQDQIMNSNFNKALPDGRAPSPHPEFNMANSMLDNFELKNWNFSFNIPTGDNSPLEGFLTTIHLSLFMIIIICLYLSYLIIMQILIKNHSSFLLNYFNNNLNFLPISLKSLIIKITTNIINLHKRFYKWIIVFCLFNLFYNLLLCFFATTYLIENIDQFCEVYINHYKK
jgi:hypothetical protein